MSYVQEIELKCSELAEISEVDIKPKDGGFAVIMYFVHDGKALRQDFWLANDLWEDSGEIGVAKLAHTLLKSEIEFYDEEKL